MLGRIVEIGNDSRHLCLSRGFLVVRHGGDETGRVPIDDVAALICNAHGLSYSNNLLVALAERGTPFVLCGRHHRPVGMLWPVQGHHRQAARMDAQLRAGLPLRKRLWKQLIQCKIGMQAAVVEWYEGNSAVLRRMAGKVRVGDPGNIEGQAARHYWTQMFGRQFRRDRCTEGVNAMLNYGYTVLRAGVARQVIAAGLHPGVPIHHANEGNPMRLVDDLMEPFRPLVDAEVRQLVEAGCQQVDFTSKSKLATMLVRYLAMPYGASPVCIVIQRMAVSLAQTYEGLADGLELPRPGHSTLAGFWDREDERAPSEAAD